MVNWFIVVLAIYDKKMKARLVCRISCGFLVSLMGFYSGKDDQMNLQIDL